MELLTSQVYAQHCRHCGVDFANLCYHNDGSQVSNSVSLKRQKLKLGDPGVMYESTGRGRAQSY